MSEPRRSTRARARDDAAAPLPETPTETPTRSGKTSLKRKRPSIAVRTPAPATPATHSTPQPGQQRLPVRLADGAPLPTLGAPQRLDLDGGEWQSIQQSGVLAASFERSRAVWTSGAPFRIFHTFFHRPKRPAERTDEDKAKMQRQKELERNFPQIGRHVELEKSRDDKHDRSTTDATLIDRYKPRLVVEPHTLPIRLFAPRESAKSVPKKAPAPSPYGAWPHHNQHGHHGHYGHYGHHGQPNQYTQYNHGQPVYQQPKPRPPPPKPVQAAPLPPPTATPAPDPVIHMLAARAGTDPELKAVMKIVAAGHASKEQLEFFQTHINELTEILAKQKAEATKSSATKTAPQAPIQAPLPRQVPQSPAPKHNVAPPPPRPMQPVQQPVPYQQHQQTAPMPYSPSLPQQQQQQQQPQMQHMQHMSHVQQPRPPYHNYKQSQSYHQSQPMAPYPVPPPKANTYRPLVMEFEEGNGDKFHFPSYSHMETLPDGKGVKLSFLITKMKPKPKAVVKPPATPAPKAASVVTSDSQPLSPPVAAPSDPAMPVPDGNTPAPPPQPPLAPAVSTPAPPVGAPRIEEFDEKNDIAEIEFYQPVTALLLTEDAVILEALKRAVRPAEVVDKYMNEVFDKCRRAEETYLAFRLPVDSDEPAEKRAKSTEATPTMVTPSHEGGVGPGTVVERKRTGRSRKSVL